MPVNFIQPTFAAGEIAPSLYARVDLAKYHAACKLLRNFFIWAHGGVSNRAGTQFVGRAKDSANPVHLIPFQFNLLQTYVLEFGHLYMRVIMNGGYVLEPALPISSITQANPGVVSAGGQGSGANILCNLAGGVIVGVELISGGSGYQGNVTLTPIASSGSGAVLVPAIVDGVIQSVTIANGGRRLSGKWEPAGADYPGTRIFKWRPGLYRRDRHAARFNSGKAIPYRQRDTDDVYSHRS